jgi:hypothetical protein
VLPGSAGLARADNGSRRPLVTSTGAQRQATVSGSATSKDPVCASRARKAVLLGSSDWHHRQCRRPTWESVCLVPHCIGDRPGSGRVSPGSRDVPNGEAQADISMVWPYHQCAPSQLCLEWIGTATVPESVGYCEDGHFGSRLLGGRTQQRTVWECTWGQMSSAPLVVIRLCCVRRAGATTTASPHVRLRSTDRQDRGCGGRLRRRSRSPPHRPAHRRPSTASATPGKQRSGDRSTPPVMDSTFPNVSRFGLTSSQRLVLEGEHVDAGHLHRLPAPVRPSSQRPVRTASTTPCGTRRGRSPCPDQ